MTLYANTTLADISKSTINVNDTLYEITFNAEHVNVNTISPNLHSYIHNSLDMNITSYKQYNGSLTLTLTKDAAANVFCITRSDVDNHLNNNHFGAEVDNNPENFTASITNDDVSLTFGIPAGSKNATIGNNFVGMAVSPLVYFKGIPQAGIYQARQDVIFNGTLVDACGRHLGEETVYFTAEQLNVTKKVTSDTKGKFSINFTIPENIESGNYTSKFEMYEYGHSYNLMGIKTLYLDVGTNGKLEVSQILSPLKQFELGTPASKVICNQGFQLIFKTEDGLPACVRPETVQKLIERGWAEPMTSNTSITKNYDPFGITALVIYHPSLGCLGPPGNTTFGCPPNNFYLKINSNSTAYLLGYNICDGTSCANSNNLSVLLPINTTLNPKYTSIGLPVNLQWRDGDTVTIQLKASTTDNGTGLLIELGNSTIVP
jgi:hypothetical protein